MDEYQAMTRALELAWKGWGRVHPNPLVGAVLLKQGSLIAEGWHAEYGGPHAEAVALAGAGEAARDSTMVVTLEPCAHQGKQPPCADALIAAGVRRVVAAMADPHPAAAGGAARLRAAGVEVELGLLARQAAMQNAVFLQNLREPGRPFVALKLATTIDGALADANGNSRWISGTEAREFVQWLRAGFDAIAVGGATARADDPSLTVRGSVQPRKRPVRVVFSGAGDLPPALELVRSARETPTLVVTVPHVRGSRSAALEGAGVEIIRSGALVSALRDLRVRGIGSLLVEGGGKLAGALLAAGLVDRYYWLQSPLWLGTGAVPAVVGLPGTGLSDARRWKVSDRRPLGEDTLLVLDRD